MAIEPFNLVSPLEALIAKAYPDTGWITDALTAAPNWSISSQAARRFGPLVEVQLQIRYTGPQVTIPANGDVNNILAFSMLPAFRPRTYATLRVGNEGRLASFGGWAAGDIYLGALAAPSAPLATNTQWSLQGNWMTA